MNKATLEVLSQGRSPKDKLRELVQKRGLWQRLDFLFYRVLCPMPDQSRIGMWWYGVSGRIAFYFHRKHCQQCRDRK